MKPLDPRLIRASRGARGAVVGSATTGVVRTAATIAIAWLVAAVVTAAVDGSHVAGLAGRIPLALVALAGAFALRSAAAWATETLALRAAARVKGELRGRVLALAAARGPAWMATRSSAAFATTLGPGLDALDAYFGRFLPQLVLTAIATPVLVAAIWLGDATSGLIVLLSFPVIPVFMVLIGLATRSLQERQQDALARLGSAFLEAVEGLATLKAFGRARRQVDRIRTLTDEHRRGTIGVLRLSFVSGFALELAASLSVALVAITIGVRLVDGTLGLGAALFVLVLAPEAFAPIRQVGTDFHAASDGAAASAAVLDVLDAPAETVLADAVLADAGPARASAAPGRAAATDGGTARGLVLDALTVDRDGVTIGPVTATLLPGTVTALVGPSGSGKSSLIAAIRGAVAAGGSVWFPGASAGRAVGGGASPALRGGSTSGPTDIDDLHARAPFVVWMDQRPRLVRGTVAENVAMSADPDIDAVGAALDAVGLDVDPATPLGAGGVGVSGGQAQRIALARARYRFDQLLRGTATAPVVLLDEPTSALDAVAEARVVAVAREMADRGAVVLVASHRQAVITASDGRVGVRPDHIAPERTAGSGMAA